MIHIRIAEAKKDIDDYSMFVSFEYNQKIVDTIRSLPTRFWDKDTKEWEVPLKKLEYLTSNLSEFSFDITGKYITLEKPKAEMPKNFKFKTQPFEHQIEGFNYGLQYDRWLLGDEQGLGKTKQVIDIAVAKKLAKGYKHCLIICGVNGLKWNWYNEVLTHSNEKPYILGQRRRKNGNLVIEGSNAKLDDVLDLANNDSYFIITNVETLRNADICAELAKACKNNIINMIAADEIHKCFDYNTPIITKTGTYSIGEIVTNHMDVEVLSYNEETNLLEYKPVTGWFENPIAEKMLTLTIALDDGSIKTIKCTDGHKFYTRNRGWVKAKDLTTEDDIVEVDNLHIM